MTRLDIYTHLDYDMTGHVYTFRLCQDWTGIHIYTMTRLDRYTHLDYDKTGHVYTFRLKTGRIYTFRL